MPGEIKEVKFTADDVVQIQVNAYTLANEI